MERTWDNNETIEETEDATRSWNASLKAGRSGSARTAGDETEDTAPHPWAGSHAKPRHSLWLFLGNGQRQNYPYSTYEGATLLGAGKLTLYFTHGTVTVIGRHLEKLATLVGNQGAFYIREQHTSPFETPEGEPYIERIDIGPPNASALAKKP